MKFWLWSVKEQPVHVEPWNEVIADKHYAATERMLTGWCGPARIVGDRVVERREAIVAERRRVNAEFDREMAEMFRDPAFSVEK